MVRLRACYFFNINQRVWVKSWRYLYFRKIPTVESVMSQINAVISLIANYNTNTPAITAKPQEKKMKTIPAAPIKKTAEESILLLAAKSARQTRQIAKLEANAEFDDACLTAAADQIATLRAQIAKLEAVQTVILRNASVQCANQVTLANQNAAKANALAEEVEEAKEATVIANLWLGEALDELTRQGRVAQAFRNIARSSKARVSSNFALPVVETEVQAAELAYFDRIAIDKGEDIAETLTPSSRKLVGFGKADLEGAYHCRSCRKHEAKRGHRAGHVPMSARETFHYLNR